MNPQRRRECATAHMCGYAEQRAVTSRACDACMSQHLSPGTSHLTESVCPIPCAGCAVYVMPHVSACVHRRPGYPGIAASGFRARAPLRVLRARCARVTPCVYRCHSSDQISVSECMCHVCSLCDDGYCSVCASAPRVSQRIRICYHVPRERAEMHSITSGACDVRMSQHFVL